MSYWLVQKFTLSLHDALPISGTGDSEGPGCDRLDYDTEVRHYREAFDQLARHPWIDPGRIVIFGSSLGSITAPFIAEGKDRKSTRLNSSHVEISYAVFCLKKK